jgi:hypothetical protein
MQLPAALGGISATWLPRAQVRDTGWSRPAQEAAYDERLAGLDVGETLRTAYRLFETLPPDVLQTWSPLEYGQ